MHRTADADQVFADPPVDTPSRFHRAWVRLLTVAAAAEIISLNWYLFRLGVIWGIIGLTLTKHVVVAWICMKADTERDVRTGADEPGRSA